VILRGLKVDPEARYPSMDGLLRDLERDPEAIRRRSGGGGSRRRW
jgi:hypothetical protein